MNKKCYKCKVIKPLDEFSRDKNRKSGRMCACKQCLKQYYEDNKERIRERRAKYYQENRERRLAYQKEYYRKNKNRIKRKKELKQANDPSWIDKQREYNRQYYIKNSERIQQQRAEKAGL